MNTTEDRLAIEALQKFDIQIQAWRAAGKDYAPIKIEHLAAVKALIERLSEGRISCARCSAPMLAQTPDNTADNDSAEVCANCMREVCDEIRLEQVAKVERQRDDALAESKTVRSEGCGEPDPSDPAAPGCINRKGHGRETGHLWPGAKPEETEPLDEACSHFTAPPVGGLTCEDCRHEWLDHPEATRAIYTEEIG